MGFAYPISPYTMVNNQFGLLDGDGKIDEDRFIKK